MVAVTLDGGTAGDTTTLEGTLAAAEQNLEEAREHRPEWRTAHDDADAIARWQARPNVLFEAGMAFGRARNRVVFVLLGASRLFTDVAGIHVLRPNNDPRGDRSVLRDTLRKGMKCQVEDSSDWMAAGDFQSCIHDAVPENFRDPFPTVAPSSPWVEPELTVTNPNYERDFASLARTCDWHRVVTRNTIILVVGTWVPAELLDRPLVPPARNLRRDAD